MIFGECSSPDSNLSLWNQCDFIHTFNTFVYLDQALFIIKPAQVESIALPARQEAVVEVIVDGVHRSPILEENEEINSDSSKMDIEPSTVNQDDVLPEVAIQSVAQPEANIIVDLTDEVAAVDGVQHPKKVVADLEDEVKSLPIEAENPSEISEDLAKLTMKKEDSAIEEKGEKPCLFLNQFDCV